MLNIFRRVERWQAYVQQRLLDSDAQFATIKTQLEGLLEQQRADRAQIAAFRAELDAVSEYARAGQAATVAALERFGRIFQARLAEAGHARADADVRALVCRRGDEALVLLAKRDDIVAKNLGGHAPLAVVEAICSGDISHATLLAPSPNGVGAASAPWLIDAIRKQPLVAGEWLSARQPPPGSSGPRPYFAWFDTVLHDIELIDFFANGRSGASAPKPFDAPEELPPRIPAAPARRSVVLMHNSYYHFNCLAAGLKGRGWDVVTVSLTAPDDPQQRFFHGQDVNLFDPDPQRKAENARRFFKAIPERFGAVHFYGMGVPGLFEDNWENVEDPEKLPWDLLELRRHGLMIGYMPSGCLDGGLQSSIYEQTGGLCDRCVWQQRPDVCSNARSLAWNAKLARMCDWVGLECDHATPERVGAKTVCGPVVTTLDPERWRPDIVPPDDMRIERLPGEIVVYHAVGNYGERRKAGRDIKGTGAVEAALERLKAEGLPVRLIFAHDIPSTQIHFLQVQADIVVDQLNYGRYGANAREAMMLGKPTICQLQARQAPPLPPLRPILEAPMVSATEQTVTDELRMLVTDAPRRADLSRRARAFAVAWHGQDACAERYEQVIDRLRRGLPPDSEDLYPQPDSAERRP